MGCLGPAWDALLLWSTEMSSMAWLLIFFDAVAFAGALLICANAQQIGHRLRVMDHPNNERKHHARSTPMVGGMAIIVPQLVWIMGVLSAGINSEIQGLYLLLVCIPVVAIVGFVDDRSPMTPLSRTLFLLLALGAAFVIYPDLIGSSLNWGSFESTGFPSWAYCALITLTTVGIVNAVNMADGQNGLVPSMFVTWSLCLVMVGDPLVASVALVIAMCSAVVLAFNLLGKLFLGDCGSYGVTFALGLLLMLTYVQGRVTIETVIVWFYIPVVDCLRVMITRKLHGHSPVEPDTNHFHHRLRSKLGKRYGLFAYIASVVSTSLIATAVPHLALVCIIVLTAIYFSFAWLTDTISSRAEKADDDERIAQDIERSFAI